MTFFYDLNKKLAGIADKPVEQQLNERAIAELKKSTLGSYAKKASKDAVDLTQQADGHHEYGDPRDGAKLDKKAEKRVAGVGKAVDRMTKEDMDESALQAHLGMKKYGEKGMKALQKAGRDNASDATMDKIRNRYDKYDEGMDEGLGDVAKKVGSMTKKVTGKVLDTLGHGSDEDMIRDLQKKAGVPQTGIAPKKQPKEGVDKEAFAALAPPKDKITFADKIAGAKKEVDEMLGDVAAEAIKGALSPKQKKLDKNQNGKLDAQDFAMLRKGGKQETDEGWDDMMKSVRDRADKPKVGSVERGHKHDIEHTATGRKVTRRTDDQGISVGADDDSSADAPKRGRGRPKGTGKSMGAKGPSGKSKLMTKEGEVSTGNLQKMHQLATGLKLYIQDEDGKAALKELTALIKHYVTQGGEQELEEKAVSKAQQKFMGMVHAAQKGEKPASKEVAKVAKSMGKKDAEDFAATKHKGLPEKKKPEAKKDSKSDAPKKKKEKTEEQGGTGTPTASSGFGFGKGIYDSLNRELETMISESMSVNMSDSTEGGKSLTITATDEDALKLAGILQMAGLGAQGGHEEGYEETCPSCGNAPCGCAEVVDENSPDWPTDAEESDDALQYAGGLNGPKSTGQTVGAPFNRQASRQGSGITDVLEDSELARIKEMAGIKEAKKPDFLDVDKDGNKKESFKKAVDDKEDKKVEESILNLTNLWKAYKG